MASVKSVIQKAVQEKRLRLPDRLTVDALVNLLQNRKEVNAGNAEVHAEFILRILRSKKTLRTRRDIWDVGTKLAENPSLGKRIRHSKMLDRFRRGFSFKKSHLLVREVGKMGLSVAISFIPLPVVKDLLGKAVSKAESLIRGGVQIGDKGYAGYVGWKKKKAKKKDREQQVKWGWKDLSVGNVDRYRWKVRHAVDVLNKTCEKHLKTVNLTLTTTICNDFASMISKYEYLMKRIRKLREKMLVIKSLCEETLTWLDEVEKNATKFRDDTLKPAVKNSFKSECKMDALWHHAKCDSGFCVLGNKTRWSEEHKKALDVMGAVSSNLVDVKPTPTSKFTYTDAYWKGS